MCCDDIGMGQTSEDGDLIGILLRGDYQRGRNRERYMCV